MIESVKKALGAFNFGAASEYANTKTDLATCTLFEKIAGNKYHEDLDDSVYLAIVSMTKSERRKLYDGVKKIMGDDARYMDAWICENM